jgi:predicted ArsR family transcriptional regulator
MTTRTMILDALQQGPMTAKQIAETAGISLSTVRSNIVILEAKGLIVEVDKRRTPPSRKPETILGLRSTQ